MQNISANDLDLVTGGTPSATTTNGTGSGSTSASGGCSDQLLTGLQSIQSSIKDLGKNQNQGLFGGQNGMLFMTMALAMRQRSEVTVVNGGGRCGGGYYSYRTGW
jgi:hypothetical protein